MTIDSQADEYECDQLFSPYQREELPFDYQDGTTIKNSEKELQSWFIENPISKDLVKSLTIRMPPNAEKEFIIVLKAPTNKIKYNLASYLVLKSANGIRRLHSSNKIEEKRIKKAGNDLEDIEIETASQNIDEKMIKVMLLGKLENPEILCMKQLYHAETGCSIVPLAIKKSQAQQKFRIPFKNKNIS